MCFIRSEHAENSEYFNVFRGSFEMRFIDQFRKPPDSNFFYFNSKMYLAMKSCVMVAHIITLA